LGSSDIPAICRDPFGELGVEASMHRFGDILLMGGRLIDLVEIWFVDAMPARVACRYGFGQ